MVVVVVVVVVMVVDVMTQFAQSRPSKVMQQISLGVTEQVDGSVLHSVGFLPSGPL